MSYKGKSGLGTDRRYASSIYYKYNDEQSNPLPPPTIPVYEIDSSTIYVFGDSNDSPIEVV